jgi:hypothetical protein
VTGDVLAAVVVILATAAGVLAVTTWDYRDRWMVSARDSAAADRRHRATVGSLRHQLGVAQLDLTAALSTADQRGAQVRALTDRLAELQQTVGAAEMDMPLPWPGTTTVDRGVWAQIAAGLGLANVEEDGDASG